jgi:chromosome segregation ATPase
MANLSLSLIEIAVLMAGAVTLGFTIHFFITTRRNFKTPLESARAAKASEEWKQRYFNDIETRDKELIELKKRMSSAEENSSFTNKEVDELRKLNKRLQAELESHRTSITPTANGEQRGYIDQLRVTQESLMEHNERINALLGQIDLVKETESRQEEIRRYNEELTLQVDDLKSLLLRKEKEVEEIRQKAHLTREMNSMLDNAYSEFNVLQDKVQKLEGQVSISRRINIEYDEIKESYYRMSRDYDDQKAKYSAIQSEHQQMESELIETEEKLREANFQRQQLQKKVAYLEELNNDMQTLADANKKLENKIKRIGELESMLNVVSEERDELARKQYKAS